MWLSWCLHAANLCLKVAKVLHGTEALEYQTSWSLEAMYQTRRTVVHVLLWFVSVSFAI